MRILALSRIAGRKILVAKFVERNSAAVYFDEKQKTKREKVLVLFGKFHSVALGKANRLERFVIETVGYVFEEFV